MVRSVGQVGQNSQHHKIHQHKFIKNSQSLVIFQAFPSIQWLQRLAAALQRSPVVIPILLLTPQLQLHVLNFLYFAYANHMQNLDSYLRFLCFFYYRPEDHRMMRRQVQKHLHFLRFDPEQLRFKVIIQSLDFRMRGPPHVAIFIY